MINYQKKILPNGLKILFSPMKETKAISIMVLTGVGSRYEKITENGLSHFLEHMFFKGTARRPTTLQISRELDAVGASYNAFTSEEQTGFYVRVEKSHLKLAVDVLEDIIFHSKFKDTEIAKEKGVILEEINMYQDMPQSYIHDLAKINYFGNCALGRSTLGEKSRIASFKKADFINYHQKFYTPDNMVVSVSGALQEKNLSEISQKFSMIKGIKKSSFEAAGQGRNPANILIHHKKTDQAHLIIGFKTFSRSDSRRPILRVLNNILGDTMSSRLFIEVREKRGLAYYVSSDYSEFADTGVIEAMAGVDIKRVKEAIRVILQEFKFLKNKVIDNKELERAKENLKGRMYLGLEDSLSVAGFLADQELLESRIKSPEELLEEIYKVSLSDIMKLASDLFDRDNLYLSLIGPYQEKDSQEFNDIIKKEIS